MKEENRNIYASLVKGQLYPWMDFAESPDAILNQLREWNEKDHRVFIYKFNKGQALIIDKPIAKSHPVQTRRAQNYKPYLQEIASYLNNHNILFALCIGDGFAPNPRCPIFSFIGKNGSKSILLPDLDFINNRFYIKGEWMDMQPYDSKENRAIFVGATTGGGIITAEKVLNKSVPRLKSAEFFKNVESVTFELPRIVQCDSPETEFMIKNLGYGTPDRSWSDQFKHKFIISMDGNGATWSRSAVALKSASVLLKYNSQSMLFYYYYLVPWKHYVPISCDEDVSRVVETERKRPGFFSPIAENATDFANKYLTKESIIQYSIGVLSEYSQLIPSISDDLLEKYGLISSNGDGVPPVKDNESCLSG